MPLSQEKEQLGTHSRLHPPSPKALCISCRAKPQGFCSGAAQREMGSWRRAAACRGYWCVVEFGWLLCDSSVL